MLKKKRLEDKRRLVLWREKFRDYNSNNHTEMGVVFSPDGDAGEVLEKFPLLLPPPPLHSTSPEVEPSNYDSQPASPVKLKEAEFKSPRENGSTLLLLHGADEPKNDQPALVSDFRPLPRKAIRTLIEEFSDKDPDNEEADTSTLNPIQVATNMSPTQNTQDSQYCVADPARDAMIYTPDNKQGRTNHSFDFKSSMTMPLSAQLNESQDLYVRSKGDALSSPYVNQNIDEEEETRNEEQDKEYLNGVVYDHSFDMGEEIEDTPPQALSPHNVDEKYKEDKERQTESSRKRAQSDEDKSTIGDKSKRRKREVSMGPFVIFETIPDDDIEPEEDDVQVKSEFSERRSKTGRKTNRTSTLEGTALQGKTSKTKMARSQYSGDICFEDIDDDLRKLEGEQQEKAAKKKSRQGTAGSLNNTRLSTVFVAASSAKSGKGSKAAPTNAESASVPGSTKNMRLEAWLSNATNKPAQEDLTSALARIPAEIEQECSPDEPEDEEGSADDQHSVHEYGIFRHEVREDGNEQQPVISTEKHTESLQSDLSVMDLSESTASSLTQLPQSQGPPPTTAISATKNSLDFNKMSDRELFRL